MAKMRVFVVTPTYNEVENLERLVQGVRKLEMGATLVVVDDNSPDGTGRMADSLSAASSDIRVVHRQSKEGLGTAYVAGIDYALGHDADIVVQMDADGSHDPLAIPTLVHPIVAGEADAVFGARYIDGGGVVGWPLRRQLLSLAGNLYARALLGAGVHDYTSGFAAFSRSALERVPIRRFASAGFSFLVELKFTCARSELRIAEVPITFRERDRGESKLSVSIVLEALMMIPRARLSVQRLLNESELVRAKVDVFE